ncbi:GTP 3',8-cyclase MoaA, partial [Candidatus Poribacteria bacterium]
PVKVNVVVMRGLNDDEIPRFAEMAVRYGWHVRFIELMPFGVGGALHKLLFFPSDQILDILREEGIDLKPLPAEGGSTARTFRAGAGRIGLISPLSKPFCSSCNRMRISADGKLRPCLLSGIGIDLKRALRSGAAGDELRSLILRAAMLKPFKHNVKPGAIEIRSMAEIGG